MGDGSASFHSAYEQKEALGCGVQGCTWKVTRRGDESRTVYVAKIYKSADIEPFFAAERDAMIAIGEHPGFSNMVDYFQDPLNGSVIVQHLIEGTKLSTWLQ